MHFFHADPLPSRIQAVYALMTNEYNGQQLLQLKLQHWEPVTDATDSADKKVAG
jgi:single-stranded-DNA-specific exonuclease